MSNTDWLAAASALLLAFLGLRWAAGFAARRRDAPLTAPRVHPAALSRAQQDTLRTLALQGQKIAAIKQLRELTGMGLKDAKDYVEALAQPGGMPESQSLYPDGFAPERKAGLPLSRAQEDELRDLVARNQKIEAIKRVREATGLGLKECKDYVENLGNAAAGDYSSSAGGNWPAPAMPGAGWDGGQFAPPSLIVEDEARRLMGDSGKISAIKYVREQTGMGLKEAKDYVEELERRGW
ncbi:MAG TPA: ribosomal protein L7/L12 [Herpetosiphonaceae bacterium]